MEERTVSKQNQQQASSNVGTNSGTSGSSIVPRALPGKFRTHCLNKTTSQWYEIQDLYVKEMSPQVIGMSESYMLVYEKK